jgi:two-component system, cell cycle response regulator CpdR
MPHILIAEDESDVREFLQRAVQRLAPAAEVTAAANGLEALNIFRQRSCDLILTDQRMPLMRRSCSSPPT